MHGIHLTADLYACRSHTMALQDAPALQHLCLDAVKASGLRAVRQLFHAFEPAGSGITGMVLLAESHLAIHTWPERKAVTMDVYVCNFGRDNSALAEQLISQLIEAFQPEQLERHQLVRGLLPPSA